jgi:hypothetical protein
MRRFILMVSLSAILTGCTSMRSMVQTDPDLSLGQISIFNETSEPQEIYIGEDAGHLYATNIGAGELWVSPEYVHRPRIRIYTGEKFDEYLLMQGRKYRLYFDPKKNRLDVKMVLP